MTPTLIFYVDHPERSAEALSDLLETRPVELSQTFALFVLPGLTLGLWRRDGVEPPAASGENAELSLTVESEAEVERVHARWRQEGRTILQPPTRLDFGTAVTAALPGPLRVRAFSPAQARA